MSEKIKVSELTESNTVDNDDLIMIVQENNSNELENFKQKRSSFFNGYAKTTDLNLKQDISNLVTSLSSSSTDTEYPSAKCVYDLVGDIDTILQTLDSGTGV